MSLDDWLKNGEMSQLNDDLRPQKYHPALHAKTVQEIDARRGGGEYRYEHDLQTAVFSWAENSGLPELEMMYAVPNGQYRRGMRMEPGLKAGVLDINLDVARGGYHGLRIELKVGTNTPTDTQREWIDKYTRYGYKTAVCYDLESVQALIVEYLTNGITWPL